MKRVLVVAVLLAAAALPAIALAKYPASPRVRRAVVAVAVRRQVISKAEGRCSRVFVSSVNRDWASVSFTAHPSRSCRMEGYSGFVLLHHRNGRWHYVTAGSYFRCPIPGVPDRVAHDLVGLCGAPGVSACSDKTVTVFEPKPVPVTLRFVLHGKVSCHKAHRLMRAYFRRATPKYCVSRGTACSVRFPGGWDCARHVAGEHDGVAGCVREAPLATVTVYGVTSHTGSPLHLSDSARRTARSGASSSTAPASGKPPATTADRRLPT